MADQVSLHDSKEDYDALDPAILATWLAEHDDEPYKSQTTRWAEATERLDGKWSAPCCPTYNYVENQIPTVDYNEADYPAPEEEE